MPPPPTSARGLLRGALWNQLGQALPVLAALLLVPRLVHGLGVERFGILSLAWMLIGYFTLFDLGVSGALTRLVSERLSTHRREEIPALVWTSLALTTAMGAVGAVLIAALAPWLVGSVLHVPPALRAESLGLARVLAAALPVVTGTAALAGVLSAQQRFGALNAIRIPMGILTYAGPLLVLPWTQDLVAIGLALAILRLIGGVAHLALVWTGTSGLGGQIGIRRSLLSPILGFGGWMTVTAVVGPLMVYMDRFVIGALLSMAMVAYYTTPYDLASRLTILSIPIVNVLFPAFASASGADPSRAARLFDWGVRVAAAVLYPFALVLAVFPREVVPLWLGPEFAAHSAGVLSLLAAGVFVNGKASGRPDLGARLHLAELPFYAAMVWFLIRTQGIVGAAVAWLVRALVDAAVLFVMASRMQGGGAAGARTAAIAAAFGLLSLTLGAPTPSLPIRGAIVGVSLIVYAVWGWRTIVVPGQRAIGWAALSRQGPAPS